jgi:phosphoserine phosphatase
MSEWGEFPEVTPNDIIQRLEELCQRLPPKADPGGVAFDGDGTLWAGDVGIAALEEALRQDSLKQEARHALQQEAEAFAISSHGSPGAIAERLLDAFYTGHYPELRACEMMVWCYAGWTEAMVRDNARKAFERASSEVEAYTPLVPVLDWARKRRLRCIVISASPKLVVEEIAKSLGFSAKDVIAGRAVTSEGRLRPALASALPYGTAKAAFGLEVFKQRSWLASFGDNAFDLDMLRAAELAVAVRPKPRLLEVLSQLPAATIFREA